MKLRTKALIISIFCVFHIWNLHAQTDTFSFLNKELNYIQYKDKADFKAFYRKWKLDSGIVVAHFGDSHVQPDIFTGKVRAELQQIKGDGGLGMLFPYKIAKTYSAQAYNSAFTGYWDCSNSMFPKPKLPLGPAGFTCATADMAADFTITFSQPVTSKNNILKLFYTADSIYRIDIKTEFFDTFLITEKHFLQRPYMEFKIPEIGGFITVEIQKQVPFFSDIYIHGVSIETEKAGGVIYHNLGVGGATYSAILAQELFSAQLPQLAPDLVVIDYGTNDYLYTDEISASLEPAIRDVIKKVRLAAPDAAILLTSAQDMNRYNKHIKSGAAFSELVKKVAFEEHCLFYDWFWVSGGNYAINPWFSNNLARKDNIHLTKEGYVLKGKLFSEAITNTIVVLDFLEGSEFMLDSTDYSKAYAKADSLQKVFWYSDIKKQGTPKKSSVRKPLYHKVKPGETLGGIAAKYHTTVKAIMRENGLKTTRISAGKTLRIPR